jgi:hypothetical protein
MYTDTAGMNFTSVCLILATHVDGLMAQQSRENCTKSKDVFIYLLFACLSPSSCFQGLSPHGPFLLQYYNPEGFSMDDEGCFLLLVNVSQLPA